MDKNTKKLLNEELDRFHKMVKYDYYGEGLNETFTFATPITAGDKAEDNLILGTEAEETEEEPKTGGEGGGEGGGEMGDIEAELGVDNTNGDIPDAGEPDLGGELDDAGGGEEELDLSSLEDTPEDTGEEEIELDVTELVQSSEEAKRSSDEVNQKMSRLMGMVDKLESDLESMRAISAKIDSLENELEKRAPTPTEKIEMRSLNSYPYNIKLSDYWKDHEDKYVDLNAGNTTKPDEQYELTRDDVNYGYSESNIRNSFDEEEVDDEDIFKFTT